MDRASVRNEIIACGRDPNYFIRKYVRIKHPTKGLIPFAMFDYQEELVRDYQRNRFNVILKARQLGISEVTAAFAAWLMLFHRDKNILVMATKVETAKNIIRKVQTTLKKLPSWLILADIITDNKLSIELSNGSVIKAIASSDDAGRSEALSLLIVDEAAFVKNLDDLWTGLLPTVQAGGRVIVLSTPNGVGNKFHQIYTEAESGENEFRATKLMWWLHPERIKDLEDDLERPGFKTSSWYRNEIKQTNMSPREVAQELECNFNASGDTVISTEWLEEIRTQQILHPLSREYVDRNLFIWLQPQAGKRYFISADVARGDGRDNSAAIVWDASNMEQHAEYYGKIPPDQFAHLLVDLGRRYNTALLVIENNTIGLACLDHVMLAGYENVYFSSKDSNDPGEAVHSQYGVVGNNLIPGFSTTPKTRPLIIAKFEEFIRNRTILLRSSRFHQELLTFIWNNGRPEAMRGMNDDLVMCASIGAWVRDTFIAPGQAGIDLQKSMAAGITKQGHVHTQIPGASKNPDHVPHRSLGIFSSTPADKSPMKIRLPNGQIADFSWLK